MHRASVEFHRFVQIAVIYVFIHIFRKYCTTKCARHIFAFTIDTILAQRVFVVNVEK